MPTWLQITVGLAVLAVLAPLVAWGAKRAAPRTKGLALLILGLGAVTDPPRRHVIEAMDREEDQASEAGDPPKI